MRNYNTSQLVSPLACDLSIEMPVSLHARPSSAISEHGKICPEDRNPTVFLQSLEFLEQESTLVIVLNSDNSKSVSSVTTYRTKRCVVSGLWGTDV